MSFTSCKDKNSGYEEIQPLPVHNNGKQYAGSRVCAECHEDIYEQHIKNAHFKTSYLANADNVPGASIEDNVLKLYDARLFITEEDDHLIQTAYSFPEGEKLSVDTMQITIGSGVKGQSFLSWDGDKLYQLQTSYYVPEHAWINSPNYSKFYIKDERAVTDQCLKCHVTYATNDRENGMSNSYTGRQLFLGVQCERCHNPAQEHVTFHQENPEENIGKFITRYANMARDRRVDACAQCHSGLRVRQLQGSPFEYQIGDDLAQYSKNYQQVASNAALDVHGNQVGLLQESACFKATETMDCITCHDPHKDQRGDVSSFNAVCISCHASAKNTLTQAHQNVNGDTENCIACHMPLFPSESMKIQLEGSQNSNSVKIRTHKIAVYPQVVNIKNYIDQL